MSSLLSLTTETISTVIKLFFSVIMLYFPLINISKYKVNIIKLLTIMVLTETVMILAYILFQFEMITSFIAFLSMVAFTYINKKNLLLSIVYATITIILIFSLSNGICILSMYLFKITANMIRESDLIYWSINFLTLIIALPISKVLGNLFEKFISAILFDLKFKVSISVACFFILTLVIFVVNVYLSTDESNNIFLLIINSVLLLMDFAFIVFITFNFIRIMRQNLELKHNQELLQNLKSYINSVENIQLEMRDYRHDIVNILSTMYNYIENNDLQGLKKFFNKNILPIRQKTSAYGMLIKQLENIHIYELNGIITIKLLDAVELGINVHVEICEPIDSLDIEIIDLVRVVGILLDNAIEECQKDQDMFLQFAAIKTKESIKLIFINQLSSPIPVVSRIFEQGYSTKGESRGTGLFYVRKILGKYKHIILKTEISSTGSFDEISHELIFPGNRNGCDA